MKRTVVVATMTSLAIASVLFAGNPMSGDRCGMSKCTMHKMHCKKMDNKGDKLFKVIQNKLDLSEKQEQALDTLIEESMIERKTASMRDHFKEMKKEKKNREAKKDSRDMSKFMSAEKFDKEAFKKIMQDNDEKRNERMQKRQAKRIEHKADTMEKIFAILTPQQRTKLIELSQKK